MGLVFRVSSSANTGATYIKNAPLAFDEGDGNFAWLSTNLSGSVVSISGSVSLSGSFSLPTLTTTSQNNVVTVDITTGQLYYTASSAFASGSGGGSGSIDTSSLLITASATDNIITFTKGDSSTFLVAVNTGSLFGTASWALNVTTASHALSTVSASYALSSSFAVSSSYALSSSYVISASFATTSSHAISASYALSSSYAVSASYAHTSSFPVSISGSTFFSTGQPTSDFSLVGGMFLGQDAGKGARNANNAIFLGNNAGFGATSSVSSNFIGYYAGQNAAAAGGSNFIGSLVGQSAVSASNSIFIGGLAGAGATYAAQSNFIGNYSGLNAVSASYSTFIGHYAGQKVGGGGAAGPGANNIVIGTGITVPNDTISAINLGGIIYATGSWYNTGSTAIAGPVTSGKVGINQFSPQYALDVSGTIGISQVAHFANLDPLPSGNIGDLAVSESTLWFYAFSGSLVGWKKVSLIL